MSQGVNSFLAYQRENKEMKRERQWLKRFALKSAGNLKRLHRKQDPLANQSRTRGHNACYAATKQLIQGAESQAPQLLKKKKKKINQKNSYSYDHPKYGQPRNRGAADSPDHILVHRESNGRE